jgi:hypothetical protein
MLHRNIAPESILINQHGAWKIAGFEYCLGKGFFFCSYRSINHLGRMSGFFTVPLMAVLRIRIHRIHMFLGLPDPDPLVRGMDPNPDPALDPDPDPSIIMQK